MSEAGVNYGERGFPGLGSRLTSNSKPTKSKDQVGKTAQLMYENHQNMASPDPIIFERPYRV